MRAIDVHVSNLRRKLEDDPRRPRRLLTVRGVGYKLVP
jgi:DNA-binding response OmpR family regulator